MTANRVHLFEEHVVQGRKAFHYVLGGSKVRRGRERTLCGRSTDEKNMYGEPMMRRAAPFKPGDARGQVHYKYACNGCVSALDRHVEVWGL